MGIDMQWYRRWMAPCIGVIFVTCHVEMHLARMRLTRAPLHTSDIMMTERPYIENIDAINAKDQIRWNISHIYADSSSYRRYPVRCSCVVHFPVSGVDLIVKKRFLLCSHARPISQDPIHCEHAGQIAPLK